MFTAKGNLYSIPKISVPTAANGVIASECGSEIAKVSVLSQEKCIKNRALSGVSKTTNEHIDASVFGLDDNQPATAGSYPCIIV